MLKHITVFLLVLVLAGSLTGCSSEETKRQRLNEAKYEQNRAAEYRAFLSAVSNDIMNALCSTDICVYNHKSYHVGFHNAEKFNERVEWIVNQKNKPMQERYKHEECLAIAKSGNRKLYREKGC